MDTIDKAISYFSSQRDNPIASQELTFWNHLKEQSLKNEVNERDLEELLLKRLEEYLEIIDILES